MKVRPALPPLDPMQRYSIDETIAYLRSSRKSVFEDIREGRLASIKEGKRRFIPGSEIARRSQVPAGYRIGALSVPATLPA
jgi:hypothetical protein